MIAKDLINETIIPLRSSDNGYLGMQMMDEYKVEHLPIVEEDSYLGLISELDILNSNDPEISIEHHTLSSGKVFIYEDQHIFDVIQIAAEKNLTVIPVVTQKMRYVGVVTFKNLIQFFAELTAAHVEGSIIVIEVNSNDYILSQIAQIVEYNDAKILNSHIITHPNSTKMDVHIKVNKTEIAPIIQTFNRYNYIVKDYYTKKLELSNFHDRYDEFMSWLNI